ncbi:hypothetical protein [Psychrobacillus sp.]|uniref:hypothetical protein n=1 Tax=Psychrobacillus sp. TaxID=1871623 RepID=UPI0028BF02AD|nr:hypothetical protein [Psychrobacillus sp.]
MSERKIERNVLYSIIFVLIFVLYILISGIINSIFEFNFYIGFKRSFWGPASTFLGALLGAGITGLLAVRINQKETQRLRNMESEKGNKVLRVLNHYSKNLFDELESILFAENSINIIRDPMQDVPIIEVNEDEYGPAYFPDDEIMEYNRLIKPLIDARRTSAQNFIEEYRKFREINTDNLNYDLLDKYLWLISEFKLFVLPVINEIKEKSYRRIKEHEKEKIQFIFHELSEFTKVV